MSRQRATARLLALALVIAACGLPAGHLYAAEGARAKYVFLMIGDGMGAAQRSAAERYLSACGVANGAEGTGLVMDTFPAAGTATTHAANARVTDSAAAGTALACGEKTRTKTISMDAKGERKLKTLAEHAHERGMKVGIVSSAFIDDATPACFYAHQPNRSSYYEIAMELAASDFDYFGGGAARGAQTGLVKDRKSPLEAAGENGFRIVTTREELAALAPGCGKVWACNHTTTGSGALYYEIDRPADHISLAEFTRKGIELLDGPDGFFMMVEGGNIDPACHANDTATAILDTLAFDEAVAEALTFYYAHQDETLIVVTADHECGGMVVGEAKPDSSKVAEAISGQKMSGARFGDTVDAFRKDGVSFEQALPVIQDVFGLGELNADERDDLAKAYSRSMMTEKERDEDPENYRLYGYHDPLTVTCTHIIGRRACIEWTSYGHTAVPVPVTAIGVGCERFGGDYDNTDVFAKILAVMGDTEPAVRQAEAAGAASGALDHVLVGVGP